MIVLRSPSAVHIEGTFRAASLPAAAAAAAVPAAKPAVPAPQARSSPFLSVPEDLQTTYKREEKIEKKISHKKSLENRRCSGKSWLFSGRPVLTDRTVFVQRSLANITISETLAGEVLLVQHRS